MIGFMYHEDYNKYVLGLDHPLVGDKPRKTLEFFEKKQIMKDIKLINALKATENDLLKAHSQRYVDQVKKLSETGGMLSIDTPVPVGIYDIARLVTGGTKLAGEKLIEEFQCMVDPLAGFHHACEDNSSGFCYFNDIAVVIEHLREKYKLERFGVVDLDVHHANGTQEIYYDDSTVLNISFHQDGRTLYPGTGRMEKTGTGNGEGYTVNMPLPPGTGNHSYLKAFDEIVPSLLKQFKPEVIIYQCGVDTHHLDPMADLCLTHQVYHRLAREMNELASKSCNKLLVLFGGGYNSHESVISYYNIMCGLLNREDYVKEKEITDKAIEEVETLISELKIILKTHWEM